MNVQLTKRDYFWTGFVLVVAFLVLPLTLWRVSVYRVHQVKADIEALVSPVLQQANEAIVEETNYLVRGATSVVQGTYEEQYSLYDEGALQRACGQIQRGVNQGDSRYRLADWNCSFFIKTDKGIFRASVNNGTPKRLSSYDRYLEEEIDTLVRSGKSSVLRENGRSYWVTSLVRSEPLVAVSFLVEPFDQE